MCHIHGKLPLTSFCVSDLMINRHRCKQCLVKGTQRWRRTHPLRHIWALFVQRARKRFGTGVHLSWHEHGENILQRLLEQHNVESPSANQYILTWPKGTNTLDINQLVLVQR